MIPDHLPWPLVFQVLGVVAAVWLVVSTWQLWLLVFTAVIIAAAMLPAARHAARYRVPRGVTVLAIYLVAAALFSLVGRLMWPALSEQSQQFMEQLPRLIENVKGWVGDVQLYLGRWSVWFPEAKAGDAGGMIGPLLANTFKVTAGVVGAVVGLVAILVIAAYIVMDAERIGRGLLRLFAPHLRPRLAALAGPVMDRIGGYVRGQLVVSACVGTVLALGLTLLGVRYALLIGVLAAVLNVVPWVGSLIASVLGILSALNESAGLAAATVLLFWGANLLEAKVLVPHFVGRATGLHPLVVLVALLAGAHLAGIIGALVAVPLAGAVWEILRQLYVQPDDVA